MKKQQLIPAIILTFIFVACNSTPPGKEDPFFPESVKHLIVKNGKKWGKGLINKDASIIADNYDENAHYLPDNENALHGNKSITEYWKSSFGFINDIQLSMETLEGTKELLYETGHGIALVLNNKGTNDTLLFKYVNSLEVTKRWLI